MSATSRSWTVVCSFCVLLVSSACFSTTAPARWLPTAAEAQREAYGGWIKVDYKAGVNVRTVQGELIAAAPDSVHVLTVDSIVALPTATVIAGTLTTYDMKQGTLHLWIVLGALSTASHGGFLIVSAPVWIIAGATAEAAASKAPRVQSTNPALLRAYARFPQGIPPGLDPRSLRQKDVRTVARR